MAIAHYSKHAETRLAQRGFKAEMLETLYAFGKCKRRRGADVFFMDREARELARRELGRMKFAQIEKALDAYLVVSDEGELITCAKRYRRILN